MKKIAISALLVSATVIFHSNPAAAQVAEAGQTAAAPLSGARLAGQGVLRFLGFEIYRARLWVQPGFEADNYGAHPLALELTYHRDFSAEAIARRSLEEMRRVGSFTPQQATRWQQALQAALPDVKSGDRLLGIHQPGSGAVFKMGGRVVGEVPDAEFSRLFFGIWLSPQTSEPALRQQLIATTRTTGQP
ncbi:hypothetical protein CBP36_18615 [Acidovorax carolinensis]|uniref:Chalcone isomerase domain-containing protein n=1 Tax=Acidovorax carolinensis TaxID=553814 RepID=A0A240UGE0_9BURK|nr:hypothetical protein CBP35_00300 [Acidovorax carolinensis]ART60567.1 hypothetical protein CBP36_18615 [Acidovorax carolinensis]